ncbi:MAG: membrane protein YqaA with SNARE-associated domain [Candidatus Omnitrophota bacterium]
MLGDWVKRVVFWGGHAYNSSLMDMMQHLEIWLNTLASTPEGALALFVLAFLESCISPIPSDVLQIPMSAIRHEYAYFYASIALAGSLLGAIVGYTIGLKGGRPIIKKMVPAKYVETIESFYKKYDLWTIGIAGFTPLPYKMFAISGGAFKIDPWRFMLMTFISRGARYFLIATFFFFLGKHIRELVMANLNWLLMLSVIALVGGFMAFAHYVQNRPSKKPPKPQS